MDYKYTNKKVIIICKKHGEFVQTPLVHLSGSGCPRCGIKFGIKENKWLDSLDVKYRQIRIGKYVVDGYDPIENTIYEFNGDFWHGNPTKYNSNEINSVLKITFGELYNRTMNRENELKILGYNIISIWESDF